MLVKVTALLLLCLTCNGCHKTVQNSYEIYTFSPIETIIPNWEERKKIPFYTTYTYEDGSSSKGTSGETFECRNTENYYFAIKPSDSNKLHAVEILRDNSNEVPLKLPNELKNHLTKIKSNVPQNENPSNDISMFSMMYPPVDFLTFHDGWLVAYSGGEWGGMLLWVTIDGAYRVLSKTGTNDLVEHNGLIYSAHGVDHLFTSPEHMQVLTRTEHGFDSILIPTPSAVMSLDAQGTSVVGLMSQGIIYLKENGAVHYRRFSYKEPLGFNPKKVGFLPSGDVYISGNNVIGVYDSLPEVLEPNLFIPTNCEVIFEKEIQFSRN